MAIGSTAQLLTVVMIRLYLASSYEVGNMPSEFNVEQGQAKYKVPIEPPKGFPRHLLDLDLEYDSGSSNGPMGLGWTINGLSQISRCAITWAQDGRKGRVKYDNGDKYCLDGSRLELTTGIYGTDGSTYSTEIDSFSRIYNRGSQGFEVRTKNNRKLTYGRIQTSLVMAPGQNNVHAWKLDSVSDYTNNVVNIAYVDSTNGYLLANVTYKDILIVLDYEARGDVSISYFNGGVFQTQNKRLKTIRTLVAGHLQREMKITYNEAKESKQSIVSSIQLCGRNGKCQKPVQFAFQGVSDIESTNTPGYWINQFGTGTGGWQVTNHPRWMVDMNDDGLVDVVGIANAGVMVALNQNGSFQAAKYWVNSFGIGSGGWNGNHPRHIVDVNGDQLPDIVGFASGGVYVSINTGSESFTAPRLWLAQFGYSAGGWRVESHPRFVKDVNGDGLPDIVGFASGGVHVSLGTGSTFQPSRQWIAAYGTSSGGWSVANHPRYLEDVNGDGLPDIVGMASGGVYVSLNTGSSFAEATVWGSGIFGHSQGWRTNQHPRFVIDVNGDGLADIVGYSCCGVEVSLSTGSGFLPSKTWISGFGQSNTWRVASNPRYIHDMNGDGLPDVVGIASSGVMVALNTGSKFAPPKTWVAQYGSGTGGWSVSNHPRYLVDVTGDGISDIVGFASGGVYISTNNNKATLMTSITDSFGNTKRITYSSLADKAIYTRGETTQYPDPKVNSGQTVVKQFEQSNGIGGLNTTQFTYKGMRMNIQGRGSLGFEERSETLVESEESSTTMYHQTFPLTTLIKSIKKEHGGLRILQSDKSYTSTGGRIKKIHMTNDVVKHYDTNGGVIKSETLSVDQFDKYGNIIHMKKETFGNGQTFMQMTVNNYSNNINSWYIGELDAIVVTYGSGSNSKTRRSTYYYNRSTRKLMYELREPEHHLGLNTSYIYDNYGIVVAKHKTPIFPRSASSSSSTVLPSSRSVFLTYDSNGNRLLSSRNNLNHAEVYTYDINGNLATLTGANGLITRYSYDEFDRKIYESRPDGTETRWYVSTVRESTTHGASYMENITRTGAQDTIKMYDSFERPIRIISTGFGQRDIYEDIEYSQFGHVKQQSLPYFNKDAQPSWVKFQYDKFGRETIEERPMEGVQNAIKKTVYKGLVMEIIDANGHSKTTERDAIGRVIRVTDALNGSVKYDYDAVGNLLKTTDPAGHITEMTYDQFGNKLSIIDPDMGHWQYTYNAYSEKLWQKDAVGNEIFYSYDQLGRLIETNEPEGKTEWIYDQGPKSKGKLSKTQSPNGHIMEYMYDTKGREAVVKQTIDGEMFEIKSEYNALGKLYKQTMPEDKEVHYCYDDNGFLTEVRSTSCDLTPSTASFYWRGLDYDSFGHISKEQYGNSLLTGYEFDDSNYLRSIKTWDVSKRLKRDWEYTYDSTGNMISRKDLSDGMNTMETFSYDALDRITRATIKHLDPTKDITLTEDWEYDSIGNLRRYSGFGGLHYQYSAAQPHAVTKAGPNTYKYDLNGNMIQKNNQHVSWTSFNKPKTMDTKSSNHVEFEYDAHHSRFKKVTSAETVVYIGKLYERSTSHRNVVPETQTDQITHKYYIYALGRLVAIESKKRNDPSATVKYLHGDHLDSVDTVTNANGDIIESLRYNAYGQRRSDSWADFRDCGVSAQSGSTHTNRGFTGHEHIEELDLIHMNGRIYDPVVGRFLSPDPHVQDPYNTQSYNRYSYTLNNPLKHKDPSGYFFKKIGRLFKKYWRPIVAVAATVVTFGAAAPLAAGLVATTGLTGVAATVASGALAGAASGFVGGTIGSGSVKGGLQGALGGAVSGGLGGYFGSAWNLERVATQAIGGGVATELSGGEFKDGFLMAGITASAHYLYNTVVEYDSTWKPGGPAQVKTDNQMPIPGANNIGTQGHKTIDPTGWFNEGGIVSRVLNKVPGVNSVAGMHDVFQVKLDGVLFPGARDVFNVPGMIPAAAISYAALLDGPASQALLVDEKKR
ncbi:unnamed protein product [Owenia fusiformis]|uniref:Insecticide toxin TcdB middle/N-terminal domain-containing protein n=1 Tax=Owenia fusiformis TaxID=6347 RepID=A0A8J1TZQ6_OWEFU|nr:unnamed protein product [Owenia fusiformis]